MRDLTQMTSALRAYMDASDPSAEGFDYGWDRSSMPYSGDPTDTEYRPTGNAKFDAIMRAVNPKIHYGGAPGVVTPYDEANEVYIDMPRPDQFTSQAAMLQTMAHELVHYTKAPGIALRPPARGRTPIELMFDWTPPGYAQEELTADIGAGLLLDAIGENPDMKQRGHYLANWASSIEDPDERAQAIERATVDAQRAVSWLLDKGGIA